MNATLIGVLSSFFTIILFSLFRRSDKNLIYGLILAGIGFLYVGFTWTDTISFITNLLQALFFLFIAYYGIKKDSNYLIAGYFMHGLWDLAYDYIGNSALIPPHYDFFCMTYDFIVGFYLLILKYQQSRQQ